MAVDEYTKGTLTEANKEYDGLVALGETNWQRAQDRLKWAERMLAKGYVPISQLSSEQVNELKAEFQLRQTRTDRDVFQKYTAPRVLKTLAGKVYAAQAMLNYQDRRLQRQIERQELLESMVDKCTIRAPHDGFVIYATDPHRQIRIEPGLMVWQKQDLFYLPDLSRMVALAMIHESVAHQVRPGMRVKVRVEGLPLTQIEGHVESVAQLPTVDAFSDVRYFNTAVVLDTPPRGLRPGMTAEVEIATQRKLDVLTIPIEALSVEEGQDVCYVTNAEKIERRPIKVGELTEGYLEIREGLDEGEQVVLNPESIDVDLDAISPFNADLPDTVASEENQAE